MDLLVLVDLALELAVAEAATIFEGYHVCW